MNLQEIKEQLTIGDYGEMCLRNKLGYYMVCYGTVIFISKKGTVTFYDNDKVEHHKKPEEIVFFYKSDKLPAPINYKGKEVTFDGGQWIYVESEKQVDFKDRPTHYDEIASKY
jgi:hypothetical protein